MNRYTHFLAVFSLGLVTACAAHKPAATPPPRWPAQFAAAPARIASINTEFKFVVLDFDGRAMPAIGTQLSVYRGEERVGTVQITEPVRARLATADILVGELRVGDEAR